MNGWKKKDDRTRGQTKSQTDVIINQTIGHPDNSGARRLHTGG